MYIAQKRGGALTRVIPWPSIALWALYKSMDTLNPLTRASGTELLAASRQLFRARLSLRKWLTLTTTVNVMFRIRINILRTFQSVNVKCRIRTRIEVN